MLEKYFQKIRSLLTKCGSILNNHCIIKNSLVFSFFFLVFFYTYFSVVTVSSGDDHFFHIRFAETIKENGLFQSFQNFKSIYFSKIAQGNEYFVYYNFLFYVFLIPFTYISPLFLGIKLYAVFASALGFTILYWCLKKIEVKHPFFWSIVSLSLLGGLIFRFFLSRPYTLAPALLILLLYFLHSRKYLGVFIISFLYIFWHSSTFYLPLAVIFTYYILEKFYGEKGDYKNVLWGSFAIIASLATLELISNGFISYMTDIIFGIYRETILGKKVNISEGNELYKLNIFELVKTAPLFFGAYIFSVSMFIYGYMDSKKNNTFFISNLEEKEKRKVILTGVLFFLSSCLLVGTVYISRRFQDFLVFFGALFVCISLSDCITHISINKITTKKAFISGMIATIFYLFLSNMLFLQDSFSKGTHPETFKAVGEWINKNVKPGAVVYNVTWNWFPQLYYYSSKHNYVIGLEPRFLYEYNHELYWKWSHISGDGFVCAEEKCDKKIQERKSALRTEDAKKSWFKNEGDRVADTLIKDFQTHYIVTSKDYISINELMNQSSRFEKTFNDKDNMFIYQVN